MAENTFGYTTAVNYSRWGGASYYACVGLRSEMPEDGTVIKIAVYLARRETDVPKVWGAIWSRSAGTLLAVSANSVSPTNTYSGSNSSLQKFTFDLPETKITGGTPLWIGFAKQSNETGRALYFGLRTSASGQTTDYHNASRTIPGNFSSVSGSWSSEALWVEVTYKVGGTVKVWNGSAQVDKPAKVWSGSAWVEKTVKHWNGTSWKESS